MNILIRTIQRDLTVVFRNPSQIANPLAFFGIVVSLFPLGISPSPEFLSTIAPGVIWIAALLSMLLSMDLMFKSDFDDGSLEQMLLQEEPLILIVSGKMLAHWLMTGFLLTLIAPVICLVLYVPDNAIIAVTLSLLVGTPLLSLLGGIGASLTVGLSRGGLLVAILILPLVIPVLILATELIKAAGLGLSYDAHLLWLLALLSLMLGIAPVAATAGVRIAVSQ